MLEYHVYQQDGTLQKMTCADTTSNRLFVNWVHLNDRPLGRNRTEDLKVIGATR